MPPRRSPSPMSDIESDSPLSRSPSPHVPSVATSPSSTPSSPVQPPTSKPSPSPVPPVSELHSVFIQHRLDDAIYDQCVDQIEAMGPLALGEATFGEDILPDVHDWTPNISYKKKDGSEYVGTIIGEIRRTADGTMLSSKGNHYLGRPGDLRPITDKSMPKNVIVVGKPTASTKAMAILFDNQVATCEDWRLADVKLEEEAGQNPVAREVTRQSNPDPSAAHGYIAVHLPPTYGGVQGNNFGKTVQPKKTMKRSMRDVEDGSGPSKETTSPFGTDNIRVGTLYEPSLLPDYGGPVFRHEKAKLVQQDIRGVDNKLITPWDAYSDLRPGTLVLIRGTLHCYVYKDGSRGRKIYQFNALNVKVISQSDFAIEPKLPPMFPGESSYPVASGSGRASTSAVDDDPDRKSFDNFSVAKRQRKED